MQKSLPLCFEVTEVAFHIHLSTARIGREREFYIKIASIYFFFKRTNLKTPFFSGTEFFLTNLFKLQYMPFLFFNFIHL